MKKILAGLLHQEVGASFLKLVSPFSYDAGAHYVLSDELHDKFILAAFQFFAHGTYLIVCCVSYGNGNHQNHKILLPILKQKRPFDTSTSTTTQCSLQTELFNCLLTLILTPPPQPCLYLPDKNRTFATNWFSITAGVIQKQIL